MTKILFGRRQYFFPLTVILFALNQPSEKFQIEVLHQTDH